MTVKIVTYRALEPGPTLTVLGAVHGNERCGAEAIGHLIADIEKHVVTLKRGTLQLVPIVNPRAYKEGVRYVERNLNRYLYPKDEKKHYEDHLDPILCGVLDKTDALLDLHSYTSQGGPFIFLGPPHKKEIEYARSLGIPDFVYGWADAFGTRDNLESQGTTEYARTKGALAITLECGNHHNADAADVGYRAIKRALAHFGMLDAQSGQQAQAKQRWVKMRTVYRREAGATLAKPWKHFDPVAKGEPMAKLANGEILKAPEDGFIILPKESAVTGEDWFFFGVGTAVPA